MVSNRLTLDDALAALEVVYKDLGQVVDLQIEGRRNQQWFAQFIVLVGDTFEKHQHIMYNATAATPAEAIMLAIKNFAPKFGVFLPFDVIRIAAIIAFNDSQVFSLTALS